MGVSFPADVSTMGGPVASPGFEGFEKRLEVEFHPAPVFSDPEGRGLRALSRAELDGLLSTAKCAVVAQMSNADLDSYVLSESSLFVYPQAMIIKTCGTTQLLRAVPELLELAARLSLKVCRVKYTRGTFMFPAVQPYPHGSFGEEVRYLEKFFGNLGDGGKAYIMGNVAKFPSWHIYSAVDNNVPTPEPVYTLEVCMTQLAKTAANQFFKATGLQSGADMTKAAGIGNLLPKSQICDFAFDPCGYSMNGIEGGAHSTIHVTPEEGFSYASFEAMGYGPQQVDLPSLMDKVVSTFKPTVFAMSVHVNGNLKGGLGAGSWGGSVCPRGYVCDGTSRQELPCGGAVVFHTFRQGKGCLAPAIPLPLVPGVAKRGSKKLVMKSMKLKKGKT